MLKKEPHLTNKQITKNIRKANFYSACLTCLNGVKIVLYSVITAIISLPVLAAAERVNEDRRLEIYGSRDPDSDSRPVTKWHYPSALQEIQYKIIKHSQEEKEIKIDESMMITLLEEAGRSFSSAIYKAKKIKNDSFSWLIAKKKGSMNNVRMKFIMKHGY